jgi:hypothetical protein
MFKRFPRPEALPGNSTVFVTFTNGHYSTLMLNSLATIAALGFPAFVYCLDMEAVKLCEEYGIPHFQTDRARMLESSDFRQDRAKFLKMGVHKPEIVQRLFQGATFSPDVACLNRIIRCQALLVLRTHGQYWWCNHVFILIGPQEHGRSLQTLETLWRRIQSRAGGVDRHRHGLAEEPPPVLCPAPHSRRSHNNGLQLV